MPQTWGQVIQLTSLQPSYVYSDSRFPKIAADFQGRHVALADTREHGETKVCWYKQNDIFVPEPPQNLRLAHFEDDNSSQPMWIVRLEWDRNSEPDLRGYHVYRNHEDGPFSRITENPISDAHYVDLVGQGVWGYYVTAVDLAQNESDPSDIVYFTSPTDDFSIGESDPSPCLEERSGYTSWGEGSAHDADLGLIQVRYCKTNFDPDKLYTAAVILSQPPELGQIAVSMDADNSRLLNRFGLPTEPFMFVVQVPPFLYRDGTIEFTLRHESGPVAAISEIYLWEGIPRLGGGQSGSPPLAAGSVKPLVYPNPSRSLAHIRLSTPLRTGEYVRIYDTQGRLVRSLTGESALTWDGCDNSGAAVAAGAYFIEIPFRTGITRTRLLLMR